jgi:hypothetical protein
MPIGGLPYYIGGKIPERSSLFVQTPESFGKRFKNRCQDLLMR